MDEMCEVCYKICWPELSDAANK